MKGVLWLLCSITIVQALTIEMTTLEQSNNPLLIADNRQLKGENNHNDPPWDVMYDSYDEDTPVKETYNKVSTSTPLPYKPSPIPVQTQKTPATTPFATTTAKPKSTTKPPPPPNSTPKSATTPMPTTTKKREEKETKKHPHHKHKHKHPHTTPPCSPIPLKTEGVKQGPGPAEVPQTTKATTGPTPAVSNPAEQNPSNPTVQPGPNGYGIVIFTDSPSIQTTVSPPVTTASGLKSDSEPPTTTTKPLTPTVIPKQTQTNVPVTPEVTKMLPDQYPVSEEPCDLYLKEPDDAYVDDYM